MNACPIPAPPPPPAAPCTDEPGTAAWGRWQLAHAFSPDDAAIIEWICTWPNSWQRTTEYARACHLRAWAGWKATLAKAVIDAIVDDGFDDDIPF